MRSALTGNGERLCHVFAARLRVQRNLRRGLARTLDQATVHRNAERRANDISQQL